MKIVKPSVEVYFHYPRAVGTSSDADYEPQNFLEIVGRTCYKSEERIGEGTAAAFIKMLDERKHTPMLEHCYASAFFICDRGVTHELVRHRLMSYAQSSTRYCNYSKAKFGSEISVIHPADALLENEKLVVEEVKERREKLYRAIEEEYMWEIEHGIKAQIARGVLPTALQAEIWATANLREWQHIFTLRCAPDAHPQMREVMLMALEKFKDVVPEMFLALWEKYGAKDAVV